MNLRSLVLPLAIGLASAASAQAQAHPVTVEGCFGAHTYDAPPTRAITLNQQATEVMLALGLEGAMVGTAYMDDAIPAQWQEAFDSVPVLAERYPAMEVVLANEPDFLFAGFASAFNEDNLGDAADWQSRGVGAYLVDASCSAFHPEDEPFTFAPIFRDIEVVGQIFGVEDRAAALIAETETRLQAVVDQANGTGMTAFLYDSGDETPFSIGCCGGPSLLATTVGLDNISGDVPGDWVDLAWERVVAADPDVIILIEADWSSAAEKRAYMEADPVLSQLRAVRENRFVTVPFSQTLLGMQFVDGVETLNAQLAALN